ncbi:uncharacterized protein LOC100937097 [Pongo abelii]|uniref:uncharacterized protein LOC100937097 n=1 Tax=Pongo abelii TaxID=9601 RepID=UPI003005981B
MGHSSQRQVEIEDVMGSHRPQPGSSPPAPSSLRQVREGWDFGEPSPPNLLLAQESPRGSRRLQPPVVGLGADCGKYLCRRGTRVHTPTTACAFLPGIPGVDACFMGVSRSVRAPPDRELTGRGGGSSSSLGETSLSQPRQGKRELRTLTPTHAHTQGSVGWEREGCFSFCSLGLRPAFPGAEQDTSCRVKGHSGPGPDPVVTHLGTFPDQLCLPCPPVSRKEPEHSPLSHSPQG